jgi:Putative Ig domain/WD40-like Beta Propeller Repeat
MVSGTVSAPAGLLAKARFLGALEVFAALLGIQDSHAQVAGWSPVAGADVIVFTIDDNGNPTSGILVATTTNAAGMFSLTLPAGTALASNLVVQVANSPATPVAVGTPNVLTLPVTAATLDLSPATEAGFRALIGQALPLANYANAEINQFTTLLKNLATEFPPPPGSLEAEIASLTAGLANEISLAVNAISGAGVGPPVILTMTLPDAGEGSAYSKMLWAIGGSGSLSFAVAIGSTLPMGLTLAAATGQLFGTPSVNGAFAFTIEVTDQSVPAQTGSAPLNLNIAAIPGGGGFLERVSISTGGVQGNGSSPSFQSGYGRAYISRSGQFIAFSSDADNLVANDTNTVPDAFARNICRTGAGPIGGCVATTTRVSLLSAGGQSIIGKTGQVNISGIGAFVAIQTLEDLVPADAADGIGESDMYRIDRAAPGSGANSTRWVSEGREIGGAKVGAVGVPSISNDGRYVAWSEFPNNATPAVTDSALVIRDLILAAGQEQVITLGAGGITLDPVMSDDIQTLVFMTNLDVDPADMQAGQGLDFDIYIADIAGVNPVYTRITTDIAQVLDLGYALQYSISADGSLIAFASDAAETAADTNGFNDVFLYDRNAGTTTLISVSPAGGLADGPSFDPAISADGTPIAFASTATNLVANDANGQIDVFVRNLTTSQTRRVSVSQVAPGAENGRSDRPSINADGTIVVFVSTASNLVAGDTNNARDVFVAQ